MLIACGAPPCPQESAIIVHTQTRELYACHAGQIERLSRVSIGHNGSGKHKIGDGRTPSGRFSLHPIQRSPSYSWRMAIGDARGTVTQDRKRVGTHLYIHGPKAHLPAALHGPASLLDWTQGCVALPSVEEMRALGAWARRRGARQISIIDDGGPRPRLRFPVGVSTVGAPTAGIDLSGGRLAFGSPGSLARAYMFLEPSLGVGVLPGGAAPRAAARLGLQHRRFYSLGWGAMIDARGASWGELRGGAGVFVAPFDDAFSVELLYTPTLEEGTALFNLGLGRALSRLMGI